MPVEQSGSVTPGHHAIWGANGVLLDGGPLLAAQKVITRQLSADFNSVADQPLIIPNTITAFTLTGIIVTNSAVSLSNAVGGFYPQTGKAGTALVAAGQAYSSLNAVTKLLNCTLTGSVATTRYSRANMPDWAIYFSLTTPQGQTAFGDIYIVGIDLT